MTCTCCTRVPVTSTPPSPQTLPFRDVQGQVLFLPGPQPPSRLHCRQASPAEPRRKHQRGLRLSHSRCSSSLTLGSTRPHPRPRRREEAGWGHRARRPREGPVQHRNQSSVVSAEPQRPRRPLGQWFVSVLGNNPQATAPERWAGLETSSRHSQRPACCQRRLGASPPTGQRRGSPWALQDQRPRLGRPNPTWPPPRHQSGFRPRGHGRCPHLPAWPSSREGQRRASPPRRCRHRTARRTETLHQQEAPAPRRATSAHHGRL